MDFTKFKISLLFFLSLYSAIGYSQYDIPIYVTTSHVDTSMRMGIATLPGVDFGYRRTDSVYRYGYGGFNNLIIENEVFPIHLEEFDDFNIAAFNSDGTTTLVYSGAQGALKNEFILNRKKAFIDFAKKDGLLQQSNEKFSSSLDSLVGEWTDRLNATTFSNVFKSDESMYYKSYSGYLNIIYGLSGVQPSMDISNARLADFPTIDFTSERYYTTIAPYRILAQEFHFKKIVAMEKPRYARRYINRLNSFYIENYLKKRAYFMSTEHHPKADFLYKVSKPRFDPHTSTERRYYKNSKKTGVGSKFDLPIVTSLDDSMVDFKNFSGKNLYVFVYSFKDSNLEDNLGKWNYFASRQQPDTYYMAYALDGSNYQDIWKELQFSSQIAGLNVKSTMKDSFDFKKKMGIRSTPRVISIDNDGNILNPNVDLNLEKSVIYY